MMRKAGDSLGPGIPHSAPQEQVLSTDTLNIKYVLQFLQKLPSEMLLRMEENKLER